MARVAFCQQWSLIKGTFAVNVAPGRVNMRVLLAWMAVESGGSATAPRGAKYNFLQIKETGKGGQTSEGFAIYSNVLEAAAAARKRIDQEPAILRARGRGPDAQMRAIARAWPRGPGQALGTPAESYLASLQEKFKCISPKSILEGGLLGVRDPGGFHEGRQGRVTDALAGTIRTGADPLGALGGWVGDLIRGLGPVLLNFALSTTALALIGFGIWQLVKSSPAAEGAKQAASIAAGAAGGRVPR